MKFLLTIRLPSVCSGTEYSSYSIFRDTSSALSIPFTSGEAFDVWICDGEEVTGDLMDSWLAQACHIPKSMLVRDATSIARLQKYANGRVAQMAEFSERMPNEPTKEWEESVLRDAEMLYARVRANVGSQRVLGNRMDTQPEKETVLLVGAGIMNLITAHFLAVRGYRLRIVDQGPDPRFCQPKDWARLGVTSGGHNARMFTNTEADNYNEQGSDIYRDMQPIFRNTVRNGGWSVKSPGDFSSKEQAWVDAFERIPGWMAGTFKKNIHEVNCESGRIWVELMNTYPELFDDVGSHKDIIRMYTDPVALESSVRLNGRLGALLHAPSPEKFLEQYPSFRPAAETNHLAGGIIVDGFTVNVHLFMAKLMHHIAALGVELVWDCEVQSIQRNSGGEVTMLKSNKGDLKADHFVISPGTTKNELLNGTASENLVHGVLGIWLQIPNLNPKMQNSMKIHRRGHKVEDINITVANDAETGEDILIFGGGYGYVGLDRPAPDSPEMEALYAELEEVARIYFPQNYAAARKRGPMAFYPGGYRKFCVRPFTPTGLGLFERVPTAGGGQLIITGGNNTGGFAQAPAVGRAVLRSLMGEEDPIHVLFHPDRGRLPFAKVIDSQVPFNSLRLQDSSNTKKRGPLKLLLLCSDGPQHRYLRYRLDQTFPGYHCIQETSYGQFHQLLKKRRIVDAFWQKYHGLRRQIFGHDRQRKAYFDRLIPQDHVSPKPNLIVESVNCRDVWDAVEEWQPELTIVSGTKYIGKKLTARAGLMINMHTGHLPEYKGNHCIFFALYDGAIDKVASTLHQLTSSLDGGDVLEKIFPPILPGDNEESLYTRCLEMSIDRCIDHVGRFSQGEQLSFVPQKAEGRTFRHRDRTPMKELWLWWKLNVNGLLTGMARSKLAIS